MGTDYARMSRNAPTMAVTAGMIVGAMALWSPVFSLILRPKRGRAFGITESFIGASLILGPLAGAEFLPHVGAKGVLIISGIFAFAATTGRLLSQWGAAIAAGVIIGLVLVFTEFMSETGGGNAAPGQASLGRLRLCGARDFLSARRAR